MVKVSGDPGLLLSVASKTMLPVGTGVAPTKVAVTGIEAPVVPVGWTASVRVGASFVVPVLIWILVTLRTQDVFPWRNAGEK